MILRARASERLYESERDQTLDIEKQDCAPGNSPQIPLCFLERERVGCIPQLFYYFDSKFISAAHARVCEDIYTEFASYTINQL
jgi:hypothetical protein